MQLRLARLLCISEVQARPSRRGHDDLWDDFGKTAIGAGRQILARRFARLHLEQKSNAFFFWTLLHSQHVRGIALATARAARH